jgi:amidophosphoribosyltransferase
MSDSSKHECGNCDDPPRKPYEYYIEKYGTALYGINKLYLMMEKQSNRGQDGAGVATIKLNVQPGCRYISRYRSTDPQPITGSSRKFTRNTRSQSKAIRTKSVMRSG